MAKLAHGYGTSIMQQHPRALSGDGKSARTDFRLQLVCRWARKALLRGLAS